MEYKTLAGQHNGYGYSVDMVLSSAQETIYVLSVPALNLTAVCNSKAAVMDAVAMAVTKASTREKLDS